MIVETFQGLSLKSLHDHEGAARARALGGRIGVFPRLFTKLAPEPNSMIVTLPRGGPP